MKKLLTAVLALTLALAFAASASASSTEALLTAIDELAQHGWILNCAYRVRSDTIDDMKDEYGRPDSETYVKSAKGTYVEYDDLFLVAGYNTGDQIFELRSKDVRLGRIRLDDVTDHFGRPDHTTHSNGEKYVSYILNDTVNIKFIFPGSGTNPKLKHYNVIWLDGTSNNRTDDSGRDW